jgi:hypothetical protein
VKTNLSRFDVWLLCHLVKWQAQVPQARFLFGALGQARRLYLWSLGPEHWKTERWDALTLVQCRLIRQKAIDVPSWITEFEAEAIYRRIMPLVADSEATK